MAPTRIQPGMAVARPTKAFSVLEPSRAASAAAPKHGEQTRRTNTVKATENENDLECIFVGEERLLIPTHGVEDGQHGQVWAGP